MFPKSPTSNSNAPKGRTSQPNEIIQPDAASAGRMLYLQRTIGNRATTRMVKQANASGLQRTMDQDFDDGLYTYAPAQANAQNQHANQKFIKNVQGGQTYYRNISTRQYYTYNAQNDTLVAANLPNNINPTARTQQIEIVEPGFILGSFSPLNPAPAVGYVANIPMSLPKQGNQLVAADIASVANTYLEGFNGINAGAKMAQARGQFGMVIGVNIYDRQNTNVRDLVRQSIANFAGAWNNNNYPVAVFGFVWRHAGIDNNTAQIGQDTIPYGEARQEILQHPYTKHLVTQMRATANVPEVYIHTADADAENLNVRGGGNAPTNNSLNSGANTPLYQAMSNKLNGVNALPDVVSGGYDFRSPNGQTNAQNSAVGDTLLMFASRLDLTIRDAMNGRDPGMIYFPEPNTFYRVESYMSTLEGNFGHGKNEGAQMMSSMKTARQASNGAFRAEFDSGLALETEARDSMRTNYQSVAQGNGMVGQVALSAAHINKLFELAQSHGRMQTWVERMQMLPKPPNLNPNGQILQGLYRAAFPHEIAQGSPNAILGINANQIQQAILGYIQQHPQEFPTTSIGTRTYRQNIAGITFQTANAALTFLQAFITAWNNGTL